jgi:anti-sigma B factor antagonist
VKFTTEEIEGIKIITSLPKVLDANSAMEFKSEMGRLIEGCTRMIIDMEHVKFIDSAGCGALITVLRQLKGSGGDLKLYNVDKQVRLVFELVRMHKIVDIFNTQQEAILSFSPEKA